MAKADKQDAAQAPGSARRRFLRWRDRTPAAGPGIPILDIEGIGATFTLKLKNKGIDDSEQLVAADAEALAKKTGIPAARIRNWQDMAELIRLKGVGPQFAEVLVRCGINSIYELAQQKAEPLASKVQAHLDSLGQNVVGVPITAKLTAKWIKAAQRLKPHHADPGSAALAKEMGARRSEDRDDEDRPAEAVDDKELAVDAQHEAERGFMHRFARKTKASIEVDVTKGTNAKSGGQSRFFRRRKPQDQQEVPAAQPASATPALRPAKEAASSTTVPSAPAPGMQTVQCAQCNHVFAAPADAAEAACPRCKSLLGLAGQTPAAAENRKQAAGAAKQEKKAAARLLKQQKQEADDAQRAAAKAEAAESAPPAKAKSDASNLAGGLLRFGRGTKKDKPAETVASEVDEGAKAGLLARLRRKQRAGDVATEPEPTNGKKVNEAKPTATATTSRRSGLLGFGRKVEPGAVYDSTGEQPGPHFKLPAFARFGRQTEITHDPAPAKPTKQIAAAKSSKSGPISAAATPRRLLSFGKKTETVASPATEKAGRLRLPFGRKSEVHDEAPQLEAAKKGKEAKGTKAEASPNPSVPRRLLPFGKKKEVLAGADSAATDKQAAAAKRLAEKQARKLAKQAAKQARNEAKAKAKAAKGADKEKAAAKAKDAKPETTGKPAKAGKPKTDDPRAVAKAEKQERKMAERREREMARRREREAKLAGNSTSIWEQAISHPISSPYEGSVWEQSQDSRHDDWKGKKEKAARKEASHEKVRLIDGRSPFARLDADKHVHDAPRLPDGRSPFTKLPEDEHPGHPKPRLPDGRSPFEVLPEDKHTAKAKPRLPGDVSPFTKLPEDERGEEGRVYAFGHRPGREYTTPGGFHVVEALVPVAAPPTEELRADVRSLRREEKERRGEQHKAAEEKRKADATAAKEAAKRSKRGAEAPRKPAAESATKSKLALLGRFGRKRTTEEPPAPTTPSQAAKVSKPAPPPVVPAGPDESVKAGLLARLRRKQDAQPPGAPTMSRRERKQQHKDAMKVAKQEKLAAKQALKGKAVIGKKSPADAGTAPKIGLLGRFGKKAKPLAESVAASTLPPRRGAKGRDAPVEVVEADEGVKAGLLGRLRRKKVEAPVPAGSDASVSKRAAKKQERQAAHAAKQKAKEDAAAAKKTAKQDAAAAKQRAKEEAASAKLAAKQAKPEAAPEPEVIVVKDGTKYREKGPPRRPCASAERSQLRKGLLWRFKARTIRSPRQAGPRVLPEPAVPVRNITESQKDLPFCSGVGKFK